MTNFEKVKFFMEVFGQEVKRTPAIPKPKVLRLRKRLIREEWKEARDAIAEKDIAHIAKELADMLVVVYGAFADYGINADEAFAEVMRSNMSKCGPNGKPIYREDGKILKGPNYQEADMKAVLEL